MEHFTQDHFTVSGENESCLDYFSLASGIGISFNQIYTSSWTRGDGSIFSERMLILNFCLRGRCDASLTGNRYAIVKQRQVCASCILPTKDFYYPGQLYEGIQLYLDLTVLPYPDGQDVLSLLGIDPGRIVEAFCGRDGLYLRRMNDTLWDLVQKIWNGKEESELGALRYFAVRLLHELMEQPGTSEPDTYFTRSQITIVKEAEAYILEDLSRRVSAKELAERFGISESSFKFYVKGILGDSYLSYFRKKRMEKAAQLLESSGMKVIEVANAVGYENQGKFARVFAQTYGMSPTEFRRMSK